ncbi:hypothetical protein B2G71_18550 [Novosphingobium sp. PC22D]|uniref:hypothetical protein n=1 Tax=Novosphingobium sp. PC22D TaxID=1962403 RepID=UPI000BF0CA8D|nr:hypothetical protein [Novosphingobium sp. PC22D]PEQ11049.1 hypothetical protein B2G71_18550 [Novosphingobium sp. PC22D]
MRLRFHRNLALGLGGLALAGASFGAPASAGPSSGFVKATCNVGGASALLYAQYEIYGDYDVYASGGRFAGIVGSGNTTTHWKGHIDTVYGRYTLSGENNFVDAIPVNGGYSGKRTLQIISTGSKTFLLKDYFADRQTVYPCRMT